MPLVLPLVPGRYLVHCRLSHRDGKIQQLPSRPIEVTPKTQAINFYKSYRSNAIAPYEIIYREATRSYADAYVWPSDSALSVTELQVSTERGNEPQTGVMGSYAYTRVYGLSEDPNRIELSATLSDGTTESIVFFVAHPEVLPEGILSDLPLTKTISMNTGLNVQWGAPDPDTEDRQFVKLVATINRLGQWPATIRSATFPAPDHMAGVYTLRLESFLSYGPHEIVLEYHYTDGVVTETEPFDVYNPAGPAEPLQSFLIGAGGDVSLDDAVPVTMYIDHVHTVEAWELLVNGAVKITGDRTQTGTLVKTYSLSQLGITSVGTFTLQLKVTLSDTAPTESLSDVVSFNAVPVPAATLLDAAFESGATADWQAVVNDSGASARQKEIASQMIKLNNDIATAPAEWLETMENDRDLYLAEEGAKDDPTTFVEWRKAQEDHTSLEEQTQLYNTLAAAPTSSYTALIDYFKNLKPAFDSVEAIVAEDALWWLQHANAHGVPHDGLISTWEMYVDTAKSQIPQIQFFGQFVGS